MNNVSAEKINKKLAKYNTSIKNLKVSKNISLFSASTCTIASILYTTSLVLGIIEPNSHNIITTISQSSNAILFGTLYYIKNKDYQKLINKNKHNGKTRVLIKENRK